MGWLGLMKQLENAFGTAWVLLKSYELRKNAQKTTYQALNDAVLSDLLTDFRIFFQFVGMGLKKCVVLCTSA